MGCDIHFVVEKKHKDKWVGVFTTDWEFAPVGDVYDTNTRMPVRGTVWPVLKGRDYQFFGRLAGVRTDGPAPNGVPGDPSDLAQMCLDQWGDDGHSHCHMSLLEFCLRKHDTEDNQANRIADMLRGEEREMLKQYCDMNETVEAVHMRVIAWFDN